MDIAGTDVGIEQAFAHSYSSFHLIISITRPSVERMAVYSLDLRQKILQAYERRLGSQRALAHVFGGSLAFVEKVLRQYHMTGTMAPKPHAGGPQPRVDEATHVLLRQLVRDKPDLTLDERCTRRSAETGVRVSVPTMCRALQRLGVPRTKSRSTCRSVTRSGSSRHGWTTRHRSSHSTLST
jgi:transposase